MIVFFETVLGYFEVAFSWLLNIVAALNYFLSLIEYAVLLPVKLVGFFPPVLASAIIVFMVVWIVKGIFGR